MAAFPRPREIDLSSLDASHPANIGVDAFPRYVFLYRPVPDTRDDDAEAVEEMLGLTSVDSSGYSIVLFHETLDDHDARHLVDAVNTLTMNYVRNDTPFLVYIDDASKEVRVMLMRDTPLPVLIYDRYDERVGTLVNAGDWMTLPYSRKARALSVMPASVFLPVDMTVFQVTFTLFCTSAGSTIQYSEDVVMPSGTYATIDEIAAALNASVTRRANRNGPYYFTRADGKDALRVAVLSSQPAVIELSPTEAGVMMGLEDTLRSERGRESVTDFHSAPRGLIMD